MVSYQLQDVIQASLSRLAVQIWAAKIGHTLSLGGRF